MGNTVQRKMQVLHLSLMWTFIKKLCSRSVIIQEAMIWALRRKRLFVGNVGRSYNEVNFNQSVFYFFSNLVDSGQVLQGDGQALACRYASLSNLHFTMFRSIRLFRMSFNRPLDPYHKRGTMSNMCVHLSLLPRSYSTHMRKGGIHFIFLHDIFRKF
jgi:hypothetical protein